MSFRDDPRYVQVCWELWPERPVAARRPLTRADVRLVRERLADEDTAGSPGQAQS